MQRGPSFISGRQLSGSSWTIRVYRQTENVRCLYRRRRIPLSVTGAPRTGTIQNIWRNGRRACSERLGSKTVTPSTRQRITPLQRSLLPIYLIYLVQEEHVKAKRMIPKSLIHYVCRIKTALLYSGSQREQRQKRRRNTSH